MTDYVMAHTWDDPGMVSHFGQYHEKQMAGSQLYPWMRTLCGRFILANGDKSGAEPCVICEEAMDLEDEE